MDLKCTQKSIGQLAVHQMKTLLAYLLFTIFYLLSVSAHGEIYRLIGDHYLDIGNRWEYDIHVTEDLDLGQGDWTGTQVQRVTATQMVGEFSTKLMETTETISGLGSSWINHNYQLTPHCLLNFRSETQDAVFLFESIHPAREMPVWISDLDGECYLGCGEYDGIPEDPNFAWEGTRYTFATFLRTETITVPAGTFDCTVIFLSVDIVEDDGILACEETEAWVDPNIGIIRADEYAWWLIGGETFESQERRELTSTNLLPSKVTDPSPSNGAVKRSVDVDISWAGSPKALSYEVYFGECGDMQFQVNQTGTSYDPGELLSCTTYCWRIDPVNENGVITGDEWSFITGSNVPDLRGLTETGAQTLLNSVSLTKGAVTYGYSSTILANRVMDQNPDDGTTAECGSSVDIVISTGPWPDVNGDTLVNFTDYSMVADWWLQNDCNSLNEWCGGADLYRSGSVDFSDLLAVCGGWLTHPGLAAYWPMDDNAPDTHVKDISGLGNDGVSRVNTELLSVEGVIDTALSFNGIDDLIHIPNSDSLDIHGSGAQLSICGWFRFAHLNKPHALVWKTEGDSRQYFLNVNTSKELIFRVFKNDTTDSKAVYQMDNSFADQWIFIAGVFDGQRARLYIDGNKAGSTGDSITQIRSTDGDVFIGNQDGLTATHYFAGAMDNIMIFSRALSEQEIQNLYQNSN